MTFRDDVSSSPRTAFPGRSAIASYGQPAHDSCSRSATTAHAVLQGAVRAHYEQGSKYMTAAQEHGSPSVTIAIAIAVTRHTSA